MFRAVMSAVILSIATALTQSVSPATAAQFGTKEEAAAMVKRVQDKFRKDGADATFRAVTAKAREFHDRDLYPFIYTLNGVVVAHGAKPELVGKNLIDFQDQNGKYLIRDMVDLSKGTIGRGWVDYRWTNPNTNAVEDKSAYVEKMGDYFVGVGVYQTDNVNDNTITIISGSPGSDDTYLQIASDLMTVLNDGPRLRILPMVGIGGPQNIRDVRRLKGVDLGLTQTSILSNFRHSNERLGNYDDKIVYIAKLFNEEAHLVTRSDITALEQLQGKKVNLDVTGSGTSYSMRDAFSRLNINIEEVSMTQADALLQLQRGEIAATVLISGTPARSLSHLSIGDGVHFLPIPYSAALGDDYLPSRLTHDDYPDLIPSGRNVETIAVGAVLIAYNWPKNTDRYRRVEQFINTFFPRIDEFRKPPHHGKWQEVNLAATLKGWNRFEAAQAWLDANQSAATASEPRLQSDQFMPPPPTVQPTAGIAQQDDKLFQEFMRWRRSRERN